MSPSGPQIPDPMNLAICLSGGGFRAALFHLGVLRRLHETGVLARATTISSVSGGSILSGHLAQTMVRWNWQTPEEITEFEARVATPFRRFASRDMRTLPVLCTSPINWLVPRPRARWMVHRYRRRLLDLPLVDLPERPRFVFCAADLAFGVNWEFTKRRIGDYRAGYIEPPPDFPLAFAVAASASFPPVFGPMRLSVPIGAFRHGAYTGDDRDSILRGLRLTDGGVYDNLGLEPALKRHHGVIVSDCGAPFAFKASRVPILRHGRYLSTIMNQVSALRKRILFDLIDPKRRAMRDLDRGAERSAWVAQRGKTRLGFGTYLALGSDVAGYDCVLDGVWQGYSKPVIRRWVSNIRTDLDAFTHAEQAILENHGYALAEAALIRHLPTLKQAHSAPFCPPHPKWLDEDDVKSALKRSGNRVLHTRWFGVR